MTETGRHRAGRIDGCPAAGIVTVKMENGRRRLRRRGQPAASACGPVDADDRPRQRPRARCSRPD
ncbi:hypothetical protein WS94_09415 [Burkholderia territorii]|nr:hypothetical protein WS94_09415 [Burkholderia territorii]KWH09083.1 hypothetical protein WT59_01205 [Burkholderia territorii]